MKQYGRMGYNQVRDQQEFAMDQHERIEMKSEVLCGKAVLKGTRLSVEHLVGLLAQGWSQMDVIDAYPGLTSEDLLACLRYAADAVAHEQLFSIES